MGEKTSLSSVSVLLLIWLLLVTSGTGSGPEISRERSFAVINIIKSTHIW